MFNNAGVNQPQHSSRSPKRSIRGSWMSTRSGCSLAPRRPQSRWCLRGAAVTNTCSIASRQSYPNWVPYCMAKFAVVAVIQGAAKALAPHGIRVNGFAPGVVDTPPGTLTDLVAIGEGRPGEAMRDFLGGDPPRAARNARGHRWDRRLPGIVGSDYMTGQISDDRWGHGVRLIGERVGALGRQPGLASRTTPGPFGDGQRPARNRLIGPDQGAVHTELAAVGIQPGAGWHARPQLRGVALRPRGRALQLGERVHRLVAADYALIPTGLRHGLGMAVTPR